MAISSDNLAQLTARVGVLRLGTGRLSAKAASYELKADGTGQFIWDRPTSTDGDPDDTADTWSNERE